MSNIMAKFQEFLAQRGDEFKENAVNEIGNLFSAGSQSRKQDIVRGIGNIASKLPGVAGVVAPIATGIISNEIAQGQVLKSMTDTMNQLNTQTNPYQMKKGGYLKNENTYVTKDGRETRRGLWANVYLKKKKGKRDGGIIDNSMVDGGEMVNISEDAQMVKANNPQATDSVETPQAFLDHNEMVIEMPTGGRFVFSDYLKDPVTGESFAAIAKDLVSKRDNGEISNEEYDEYITELANDNEKIKTMNSKKKMMNGGKMGYQEGGDMMMGDPMMQGGDPMAQGMDPMAQGATPDIMPEMGIEGNMSMGQMTEEGFSVAMPGGKTYVFSPDLKDPNTGQPFATLAQDITNAYNSGQMPKDQYDQTIQQLKQAQEVVKQGMGEPQPGMKMGGLMKGKMGRGGYIDINKFSKMYKR